MRTTIANRIWIEEPTSEIKDWVKTNLEFDNPDYVKKQRMGYWLGRTPKKLRLYEWHGKTLVVPFGIVRELLPMLVGSRIDCDFRQDTTVPYGEPIPLYDYQRTAVQEMVRAKFGILKAQCGSGKTRCGLAIIKTLCKKSLWLCNQHDLIRQSMDAAREFFDPEMFGTITEGKVNIGTGLTFATVQTMAKLDLTQFRDCWDVVIVDECHTVSASASSVTMYEKVLNGLAARRKIGLTATPDRADGLIKTTFALIGNVAYEIPKEAVADRITGAIIRTIRTETEITDKCLNSDGTLNYTKLIEHITTDEERNRLIAQKIIENREHNCLVLSDRLVQLETIRSFLPSDMQELSVYINGQMTSKKKKAERQQAIEQMRNGRKKYLFGSYKIARQGLDIPCLDRLFMASPVKDSSVVQQSVGRIQRVAENKNDTPVVYDFEDIKIGLCIGWYKKRCTTYRKMEIEIEKGDYS